MKLSMQRALMLPLPLLVGLAASSCWGRLEGSEDTVKVLLTEKRLQEISVIISSWEQDHGDWPASSWQSEWGPVPDALNIGVECLVVQLWSPDAGGALLNDEYLENTDGDSARKSLTTLQSKACFELVDMWENPIAYFHNRDYAKGDVYVTFSPETGERFESTVKGWANPMTGEPYSPRKFQLISAGVDGVFGTEDDLTSFFKRE